MADDPRQPVLPRMGFAGLSGLATDVKAELDKAFIAARSRPADSAPIAASHKVESGTNPAIEPWPKSAYLPSPLGRWPVIIGVVTVFLGVSYGILSYKQPANFTPSWAAAAGARSTPAVEQSPTPADSTADEQSPTPPDSTADETAGSGFAEDAPPAGNDLLLSERQIRYCLAEDVRLTAAKGVVDNRIRRDVARFNFITDDYNSRCGRFRYLGRDMESANIWLGLQRPQLEAEGRSWFPKRRGRDRRPEPSGLN